MQIIGAVIIKFEAEDKGTDRDLIYSTCEIVWDITKLEFSPKGKIATEVAVVKIGSGSTSIMLYKYREF